MGGAAARRNVKTRVLATQLIINLNTLSKGLRHVLSINALYSATSPLLPFVQSIHLRAEQDAGDET